MTLKTMHQARAAGSHLANRTASYLRTSHQRLQAVQVVGWAGLREPGFEDHGGQPAPWNEVTGLITAV